MIRAFALLLPLLLAGCVSPGLESPDVVGRVDASVAQEELGQKRGEALYAELSPPEARRLERIRYLAVPIDNPIGSHSQPRFMVWDTLTEQIIRADFFILTRVPNPGTVLRLDRGRALVTEKAAPAPEVD